MNIITIIALVFSIIGAMDKLFGDKLGTMAFDSRCIKISLHNELAQRCVKIILRR